MLQALRRVRLRTVVLVGGLLTAIVPGAVLGVSAWTKVSSLMTTESMERSQLLSHVVAQQLDDYVIVRRQIIAEIADELATFDRLETETLMPVLMRSSASLPGMFERIIFLNPTGISLAAHPSAGSDGKSAIGLNYGDRNYLKEVLATKKPYIERSVIMGRATNRPVLVVAAPVLDRAGNVRGVVSAALDTSDVAKFVEELKVGQTGRVTIAGIDGVAIIHKDPKIVQQRFDFSKLPIWRTVTAQDQGALSAVLDVYDVPRLGGFATVPTIGWKIWTTIAASELENAIVRQFVDSLAWVIAAVLVAVGAALALTRLLTRPVNAIRATAVEIAGGHLDKRVAELGPADLRDLARAVNGMASALQKNITSEQAAKQRLERAIAEYSALTARVAAGDLTARVRIVEDGELGELGGSLNQMAESLERLVNDIRAASASVASAAAEILAGTSQQVSATTEESTAVRQTAATVAEVRQTAEAAARKTRMVTELAQRVAASTEDGRRSVEEGVRGSQDAKARMEALAERILAFSEQTQAIAEINATVADLAGQSNLLAVNAGIEAAKAGDAGRGFAVVAMEVKELAGRCKEATAQVRSIVVEIQKSAQAAVVAAEQSVKTAEAGAGAAQRSGDAIAILAQGVSEASQAAQQIMAAADQQETGMDQIAMAMQNIEQSSAQTVAATQQVERAAQDLNKLAQRLTGIIEQKSPNPPAQPRPAGRPVHA
jgi:methyl-accepting chemotaxis protein